MGRLLVLIVDELVRLFQGAQSVTRFIGMSIILESAASLNWSRCTTLGDHWFGLRRVFGQDTGLLESLDQGQIDEGLPFVLITHQRKALRRMLLQIVTLHFKNSFLVWISYRLVHALFLGFTFSQGLILVFCSSIGSLGCHNRLFIIHIKTGRHLIPLMRVLGRISTILLQNWVHVVFPFEALVVEQNLIDNLFLNWPIIEILQVLTMNPILHGYLDIVPVLDVLLQRRDRVVSDLVLVEDWDRLQLEVRDALHPVIAFKRYVRNYRLLAWIDVWGRWFIFTHLFQCLIIEFKISIFQI